MQCMSVRSTRGESCAVPAKYDPGFVSSGSHQSASLTTFATTTSSRSNPRLARGTGDVHSRERLCICGVNAYHFAEILFRCPQHDCQCKALRQLTCIRTDEVEANNTLVFALQADQFGQTLGWHHVVVLICPSGHTLLAVCRPKLQTGELEEVCLNVFLSELGLCIFLTVATGPILERGEDCCWHKCVVHLLSGIFKEPPCQHLTSLDSYWCELQPTLHNITHSVNVRHICHLTSHGDLAILVHCDPCLVQTQTCSISCTACGIHDSVVRLLRPIRESDLQTIISLLNIGGQRAILEFHTNVCHQRCNFLGTLAVKATQHNGAHCHCNIQMQLVEESCTLQSNVRCPHHKRLSRRLLQGEDIVTCDGIFLGTWNIPRNRGAAANRYQDVLGCDLLYGPVFLCVFHSMGVSKAGQLVEVGHPS
mmetsp:Transcript_41163/g.69170  ORF Transcript_41163/g.69170 Transcript_41163/m.69170 type:complete len:422 (+) Transcript_41163:660-1925(+)